jgi:hypothetical protein
MGNTCGIEFDDMSAKHGFGLFHGHHLQAAAKDEFMSQIRSEKGFQAGFRGAVLKHRNRNPLESGPWSHALSGKAVTTSAGEEDYGQYPEMFPQPSADHILVWGEILHISGLANSPQSTLRSRRNPADIKAILFTSSAFSAVKKLTFQAQRA